MDPVKPFTVKPSSPLKIKYIKTAKFCENDNTKDAVLEYLKSGGEITKFPDSPAGKTPDVNLHLGFTTDQLCGYGLEYELEEPGVVSALRYAIN